MPREGCDGFAGAAVYLWPVPDFDVETIGSGRAEALLATPFRGCAGYAGAAV